mmetsp:Transcript_45487/g.134635  ORF Transcript_45487/g.134635 Transcript_45487/m.134635 type:complete len:396 (+) Transcript_45487:64-1251(+)
MDLGWGGKLLKRQLRAGHGPPVSDGARLSIVHRGVIAGRDFPCRETVFVLGQAASDLPLPVDLASAALRTMQEGELSAFRIDGSLVTCPEALALWSQDGFEYVEEAYEWHVEVTSCRSAGLTSGSTLALRGGLEIPRLGLGLYMVSPADAYTATLEALRCGYRLIDTASMYQNEEAVGRALRDAGVQRGEVFVVSKVNNPDHGYEAALQAIQRSCYNLGVSCVDLMLMHSPLGGRVLETWDALLEARRRGWARQVGVSNFGVEHLRRIQAAGREVPVVNQFEVSPFCQEASLRRCCEEMGIAVMGYSPLTRGQRLRDQRVVAIGQKHGRSPAQVLIRWALQQGIVSIPKSIRAERLQENMDSFSFELDSADLARLASCEEQLHTCWDCLNAPWTG